MSLSAKSITHMHPYNTTTKIVIQIRGVWNMLALGPGTCFVEAAYVQLAR